jgi:hypothetical protein
MTEVTRKFETLEDQTDFFEEYPEWAPVINEDGRVIGVRWEGTRFPVELVPFTEWTSKKCVEVAK